MNGHVSELMVNHQTENETESGDTETPHEQGGSREEPLMPPRKVA